MAEQVKLPAFQFYPGDWRKDPGIQALGFFERGVWFEIIVLMHESNERGVLLLNGKPMPEDGLARLLGLDNQTLTTTLTKLLDYGVASRRESDGAITSRRMIRDEELRRKRKIAGLQGGNPNLVNQKPTPSSSSSSSSSSSEVLVIPAQKLKKLRTKFSLETWKPPEGKTKYADYVYLTEAEYAKAEKFYQNLGLGDDGLKRALQHLDGWFVANPKKRAERTDDYRALIGWPAQRVMDEMTALNRLARSEQTLKGDFRR